MYYATTPFAEWMRVQRLKGVSATREPWSLNGVAATREPLSLANAAVDGVGFLPLIPALVLGGSALLGGLWGGYQLASPGVDPTTGKPLPGALAAAGEQVGKGIGNAITVAALIGVGYLIFTRERGSFKKGRRR